MKAPKLTIELVPSTAWGENLRKILKKEHWDILRKASYKRARYRCECCGGKGSQHPVECHEIWQYDDELKIQKLLDLIALCPPAIRSNTSVLLHYKETSLMSESICKK